MTSGAKKAIVILMAVWIAGCGYQFAGSGPIPGDFRRIHVPVMENRSAETGIETLFTNDLIYEMTRSGRVEITDPQRADAILKGEIRSISSANVAHRTSRTAMERRVTVVVELKLLANNGTLIRQVAGLSDDETYRVTADRERNDLERHNALRQISRRMAESVFLRLTDDF